MRILGFALIASALGSALPAAAAERAGDDWYLSVGGSISDIAGPRLTDGASLGIFNPSFGHAFAFGYDGGAWRIELESQGYSSEGPFNLFLFTNDRFDVNATMLNLVIDPLHRRGFRPYLALGYGSGKVTAVLENCYDLLGCPVTPDTHRSASSNAYQYQIGIAWRPADTDYEFTLSHRRLVTNGLGFKTDADAPYAVDELKLSAWTIGATWFF